MAIRSNLVIPEPVPGTLEVANWRFRCKPTMRHINLHEMAKKKLKRVQKHGGARRTTSRGKRNNV